MAPDRLATRVGERRGLAVGLVLTVTTIAFENLGVSTAMPVVSRDLDGVALYGWTFTAALLAELVGIAVAGREIDRLGPARPFAAGLVLFTAGLVLAGSAPTMPLLVAGRFVQGLGIGVLPPVAYASIGRAFDDRARARMFALLSSAWVVPGLIGPALSGTVAESVGWRWVFLGILPLVPLNALLTLPALAELGPPPASDEDDEQAHRQAERRVPLAVALALGAGVVIGGLELRSLLAVPVVAAGAVIAVPSLGRLLPDGTLRAARGLPAAVSTRGLQSFAFFGAQAFVPLALTDVRGLSAAEAGLGLTAGTLTWTAGAWLQDRRGHVWGREVMVRRGIAFLSLGLAGLGLLFVDRVPAVIPIAAWAFGAVGMGMAYGGVSLVVLSKAPPGQEGRATSGLQIADVLGMALGTGLGGAAVAVAERSGDVEPGIVVAFALALSAGILSALNARRL